MVEVRMRGPLFDGTLDAKIEAAIERSRQECAIEYERELQGRVRFKYTSWLPTGRWRGGIGTKHSGLTSTIHPNHALPYNHWLEGTGSRNKTTRFKGYHMWRDQRERVRADFGERLERKVMDRIRALF